MTTIWENETRPTGATNTRRPLTPSLDLSKEGLAMQATRTCTVDGCDRPHLARGWCSAHWTRWKRHGDPLGGGPDRAPAPDACTVEGCSNPPHGRGLCATHRRQKMADEDPGAYAAFLAQRRAWHAANPEKVAATRRQSRERHLDAALARAAAWRAENQAQVLANNWVHRRREYGLPTDVVDIVDPAVLFDRHDGICALCCEPVDPEASYPDPGCATVDHIVPVVEPESEHSYANTQLAHWACNRRKNAGSGATS